MTTKDTKSTTEEKEDDKRPIRPQIDTKRTIKRHKTTTDKIKTRLWCRFCHLWGCGPFTVSESVSFTDAAGDVQREHFEINVEASHSDQVCCRDLLRVFPSTPSPPYMKSVWSDVGVMVNIERPSGAEDWETSLMEDKQTAQRNKRWIHHCDDKL